MLKVRHVCRHGHEYYPDMEITNTGERHYSKWSNNLCTVDFCDSVGWIEEGKAYLQKNISFAIEQLEQIRALTDASDFTSMISLLQSLEKLPTEFLPIVHADYVCLNLQRFLSASLPDFISLRLNTQPLHTLDLSVGEHCVACVVLTKQLVSFENAHHEIEICMFRQDKSEKRLARLKPKRLKKMLTGEETFRLEQAISNEERSLTDILLRLSQFEAALDQALTVIPMLEKLGFQIHR